MPRPFTVLRLFVAAGCILLLFNQHARSEPLQAGAAVVDVTPVQFPVLVNGGMTGRTADQVSTRLYARALVLDDGQERLAMVVVDSCMVPRPLSDDAKQLAAQRTKIAPNRMMISATHTHTAPSCMGALGTGADPTYVPYLREKLAEAIAAAEQNLEPAHVGWAVAEAGEFTALRRWIRRPDRLAPDPFGNLTVRANMHAANNWDDVTGESGPEDPALSLLSVQAVDGRPLAVLANFSMHYFSGEQGLSADYFGLFCTGLEERVGGKAAADRPPFVAIMSHGCSGDIWRKDYAIAAEKRNDKQSIQEYTDGLLKIATEAYASVSYDSDADLAMAEARLPMRYRVPDKQRLEWSQRVVEAMGDREPKTLQEVYAREQIILDKLQSTEIVVQAIRIGEIAIATTPNETYALTGLKLKLQSPLEKTMVIELANGGDGYIPPPEQHLLGGYNTWPARSAGLEVSAEPRITEAALSLLEQVANRPRREFKSPRGPASQAILSTRPVAYWRLDEFAAPRAVDSTENEADAIYEPGVVFFLPGPHSEKFTDSRSVNRAAHFAGGRLRACLADLDGNYSVSLWFWNGMPNDARETSGWVFSRGRDHDLRGPGEHLGLGGTGTQPGKLVFLHRAGTDEPATPIVGRTEVQRWTWNHLALVRDGKQAAVFLNGNSEAEITMADASPLPTAIDEIFFGGRADNDSNWEGRLDEIALFDRALSAEEVARLAKP